MPSLSVVKPDDINQLHGPVHDEAVQRTSRQTSQETSGRCQRPVTWIHA